MGIMKKQRLTERERWVMARAERLGLSAQVDHSIPGWPQWSFVRQGDAMCVAAFILKLDGAKQWLDGFEAALHYPPMAEYAQDNLIRRVS